MNPKTLGILGGITLVVILAAVFIGQEKQDTLPQSGEMVFPDLMGQINDIVQVTLESKDDHVTLIRDEKGWGVKEKEGYHADLEKIKKILIGMAELHIQEPKTKNPDLYEKLGLQDQDAEGSSSTLVNLSIAGDNQVATVLFGQQRPAKGSPSLSEIYIRKPGDPQTWLATGKLQLDKTADEWLDKDLLDIKEKRIQRARIIHLGGETLVVQKEKPDDLDYQVADFPKDKKVSSQFNVNNVATTLAHLSLDDIKKEGEVEFPSTAGVQAILETFDGLRVTVETTKKDETTYAKISAAFDEALVYTDPEPSQPPEDGGEGKGEKSVDSQKTENTSTEPTKEPGDTKKEDNQEKAAKEPKKPKIKSAEEVRKEVTRINEKLGGWAFALPKFRVENFSKTKKDFIASES